MDITKLYQTQISLSEWFARLGHTNTEELRKEDNEKRERLRALHDLIGLKYDQPRQFTGMDLANQSPAFRQYLAEHGNELCALRLIPLKDGLPKLRMRGKTVNEAMDWFREQKIRPEDYRADVVPHTEKSTWSTIFIVNHHGIFGEIIRGGHHQLTQGFQDEGQSIVFAYNFKELTLIPSSPEAQQHLQEIIQCLRVEDAGVKRKVAEALSATFHQHYLCGYFETAASDEFGTWFIDYSPMLGEFYKDFVLPITSAAPADICGLAGSPGKAIGRVRIVHEASISTTTLQPDEVLVCLMTTPGYMPLMKQAAAVITDFGGILSHAAIIAREMKKPCIIGTKTATKVLKDGDVVEVDANKGVVRKV